MLLDKNIAFLALLSTSTFVFVSSDVVKLTASDLVNTSGPVRSFPPAAAVFKPAVEPLFSIQLLSHFPEDLEISDYCRDLLRVFGERYVTYVNCLVPAARPVKVCQNCFSSYESLNETYTNISSGQVGPDNVSCSDSLLRSDRLMLVVQLFNSLKGIWTQSNCENCITQGPRSNLTNDTLYFMTTLNQTLACFETYQHGNQSELCKNCRNTYKRLSNLYSSMDKNQMLCIDLEDAMNMTRKLWSKNFNCSTHSDETVPVSAVFGFMLFLPVIFYLSSFLHSEQKKRKLIHPKRAKSYATLMNIQDKLS